MFLITQPCACWLDIYFAFDSMVSRCKDCSNNLINYVEFLEMLNVDVRPGDLIGLSSQIQQGSEEREAIRIKNHIAR